MSRLLAFAGHLLALTAAFAILAPAQAAEPKTPKIDRFRAYLIYEDTGELSKNLADKSDQIVANDDKGTSVQMILDVLMTGKPDQLYENNPVLHVRTRSALGDENAPSPVDAEFPLTYVAAKGTLVRTVVVDHSCNGFDIEAWITDGNKRTSELKKSFSITCGD